MIVSDFTDPSCTFANQDTVIHDHRYRPSPPSRVVSTCRRSRTWPNRRRHAGPPSVGRSRPCSSCRTAPSRTSPNTGSNWADMTTPGSLPPQRRRVGVLPIAVIAGALVLGTATGVVVHQVSQVTASPPAASGTTSVPQSPNSSVTPADSADSPAKSPDPNETPSTDAPPGLPRSAPLDAAQFVVPRGPAEIQQLDVAWFNGPTATRRLKTPNGHRVNSPTLSVDRRTIIYIDRTANRLRTNRSRRVRRSCAVQQAPTRLRHYRPCVVEPRRPEPTGDAMYRRSRAREGSSSSRSGVNWSGG